MSYTGHGYRNWPLFGSGQALSAADRDVLIASIAQLRATVLEQQRVIERLERRIAELEGRAKPGGPPRMPGLQAKSGRPPPVKQLPRKQGPRKQRRHGFARRRLTPTQRVEHVMENCPDCGTHLTGGWTQRTREVIELPVAPVQVTEHVYIARTCPACWRRCTPRRDWTVWFWDGSASASTCSAWSPRYGKKRECPSAPASGIWIPYINCASARAPSSGPFVRRRKRPSRW